MTVDDARCPPLDALAGLAVLAPDEASVRRVRAQCLAALALPARRGAAAPRLEEAAALTAVGGFLAAIVTAALRLLAAG